MDNNNSNNNSKQIKQEHHKDHHDSSPRKPPLSVVSATVSAAGSGGGDRMKRDEWSEGAVSSLLEAYEAKWTLRNRAKLKGHDWEDVAKYVSSRANSSKSPKTQTQCKNKIESMKKRYRSESATADVSTWPLFSRLDLLLRGTGGGSARTVAVCGGDPPSSSSVPVAVPVSSNLNLIAFDHAAASLPPPPMTTTVTTMIYSAAVPVSVAAPVPVSSPVNQDIEQNSIDSNGVDPENKEEVVVTKMPENQLPEKMEIETDCSTPALYSNDKEKEKEKEKMETKNHNKRIRESRKRRRKGENWDVAESIRWLAKVMMRSEQAKVETMREVEKLRADAEVKRGELDLKRTEIIAHTQLEIARLFATCLGKAVDPSLKIGRS